MGDGNSATEAVTVMLGILVALLTSAGAIWYSARSIAAFAGM